LSAITAAMRRQKTPKTTSHQGKPRGAEGLRRKGAMPLSAHLVVEEPFPVQGEHSGTPGKWLANPSHEKPADRKRLAAGIFSLPRVGGSSTSPSPYTPRLSRQKHWSK